MPYQRPSRPTYEISQAFNDAPIEILKEEDTAVNGYMPKVERIVKGVFPTSKRTVGVTRYYAARQAQIEIEQVIRIPAPPYPITNKDVAHYLGAPDDALLRIDRVQEVDGVYPRTLELTLTAYDRRDELNEMV